MIITKSMINDTEMEPAEMDYVDLGKRVRAYRMAKNWTQEYLAREIGVSTSFIGHIERGSRKASIDTLVQLANALEISTDDLLAGSLERKKEDWLRVRTLTNSQKTAMKQMLFTLQEQIAIWDGEERK